MNTISDTLKKMEELSTKLEQWTPAEELLEQLEAFPLCVEVVNQEGKVEAVNKAFIELSGFEQEELMGKPFSELLSEKHKEYYIDLHEHFMESPFKFTGQVILVNKQGKEVELLVTFASLNINGEVKRITLSLKAEEYVEKTEQEIRKLAELTTFTRRLEERMQARYHELDPAELSENLEGHDIGNQLHHIKSIAEIMSKQNYSEEEQNNMLRMIISTTDKAIELIEKKVHVELLESGFYELKTEETDLLKSFERAGKRLKPLFERKKLKLLLETDNPKHRDGSNQPYILHADKFFIDMMIYDLLENAAQASPEGETILAHITTANMTVEISIHNWGLVDEDIKRHFFEKYVTKGKKKGTGLGTYISKMIAKAHNGMITMRSNKENGTYVVVALPILNQLQIADAA